MTRPAALLLCGLLVACAPDAPVADREIRTDTAPLTERFPAIGEPLTVSWVTWDSATGGAPGPTTYWIDAVVTLAPQTTKALEALKIAAQGKAPEVADELRPAVAGGPFLTGEELDGALSTTGWMATGYLDPARNLLVISAIDD
ncbi:hypothetical protein [Mycobacterium sp. 236(2023)]|uniref:hypothetical protein n=1 Tax=Mycobacterium sp. 236(2023) TaxID=3038163 RepID=UPI002415103F|nr:hypothetical protein [Mycobacterium sp. 236(2023)]MDG4664286.1 hypothetical protein [Mycobacterium sp. 236(2023)]